MTGLERPRETPKDRSDASPDHQIEESNRICGVGVVSRIVSHTVQTLSSFKKQKARFTCLFHLRSDAAIRTELLLQLMGVDQGRGQSRCTSNPVQLLTRCSVFVTSWKEGVSIALSPEAYSSCQPLG